MNRPAAPRPGPEDGSALLYFGFATLTIIVALGGGRWPLALSLVFLSVYLGLELVRVPPIQRWVGLLLCAGGLAIGAASDNLAGIAVRGAEQSLQFLVLFLGVACLRLPALRSTSLLAVGQDIANQQSGRRFLAVAFGSHLFGAVLNLAGLQLVASVLDGKASPQTRQNLALAMLRGFSAASCWSPLFAATAVVLSVVPGVTWFDLAIPGMITAALLITMAWIVDRAPRPGHPSASAAGAWISTPADWTGVAVVFLSLCVAVIGFVELARVPIPIAIGLVAPVHAVIWLHLSGGQQHRLEDGILMLLRELRVQLPNLRSEVLLFTGASLFGTGIAAAMAGGAIPFAVPTGDLALIGLVTLITAIGLVGLHPVIPILVIGQALPPDRLGLSATLVALAMMASWGLAALVSPFSGTTLFVGRLLQIPVWTVAWRWNAAYGVGAAMATAAILIGLRHAAQL